MIIDLVKFTVKSSCVPGAIAAMTAQTDHNKREPGCVLSHVFQSQGKPEELYMLLGWESEEAVAHHLKTAHDAEFREALDDKLVGPPEFFAWSLLM